MGLKHTPITSQEIITHLWKSFEGEIFKTQ